MATERKSEPKIWIVRVGDTIRAVRATRAANAWRHVAESIVGEARRATPEDGMMLASQLIPVEEISIDQPE